MKGILTLLIGVGIVLIPFLATKDYGSEWYFFPISFVLICVGCALLLIGMSETLDRYLE